MKKDLKIILVITITILALIILKTYNDKNLKNNGLFTIATVNKINIYKGGYSCEYSFYFDGYYFIGGTNIGNPNIKDNNYFVLFNPEKPSQSRLLLTIKVPDSITVDKNFNGWEKLPISVSEEELDNALRKNSNVF